MKRVLIVGAGGFARELHGWLQDVLPLNADWRFGGFLDDNSQALDAFEGYAPGVFSSIAGYRPAPDDLLLMGIGHPRSKLRIGEMLVAAGAEFATLVHPSAIIGRNVKLGRGVVICPRCVITCDVVIEEFTALNVKATVGHDVRIGPGTTLSAHVDVTGGARLGTAVFAGSHAVVLPKAVVGDDAVIGAGSVVLKKAPPSKTVFGIPARPID